MATNQYDELSRRRYVRITRSFGEAGVGIKNKSLRVMAEDSTHYHGLLPDGRHYSAIIKHTAPCPEMENGDAGSVLGQLQQWEQEHLTRMYEAIVPIMRERELYPPVAGYFMLWAGWLHLPIFPDREPMELTETYLNNVVDGYDNYRRQEAMAMVRRQFARMSRRRPGTLTPGKIFLSLHMPRVHEFHRWEIQVKAIHRGRAANTSTPTTWDIFEEPAFALSAGVKLYNRVVKLLLRADRKRERA